MGKLSAIFLLILFSSGASATPWDTKLCVPVAEINLYPFRVINDGKEMAYLTLLRSYISTNQNEPGILKAYEFTPDGKVFTGRINKDLKWNDGSPLTAQEALDGIAKTLPFRTLGERVKVAKASVLDKTTFQIVFKSDVQNLTGVLREALTTNSRHNRMWPVKAGTSAEHPEILAKFPFIREGNSIGMNAFKTKVQIVAKPSCEGSEISMFRETLKGPIEDYVGRISNTPAEAILQTNTARLPMADRKAVVQLVRTAFAEATGDLAFDKASGFFAAGEPGHSPSVNWPENFDSKKFRGRTFKIAVTMPILKDVVSNYATAHNLKVTFVPLPAPTVDADAILMAATIEEGRHLFLQDAMQWPHTADFAKGAPKTRKALERIASLSAATRPPDPDSLRNFEKAAVSELSLAPVARRYPHAFSHKRLPICLNWTKQGELTVSPKEQCVDEK